MASPSKKAPKLSFVAPTLDQELPATSSRTAVLAGDFEIKLAVKDWDRKAKGSHIHFILDEGKTGQATVLPAGTQPHFDAPLSLFALSRNKPLAAGEHVLAAFACRVGHESIKTEGSLAVVRFWVGPKRTRQRWSPTLPMLLFYHPEVQYEASGAARALIDWQLCNVTLGAGHYRLDLSINEGAAPRNTRRTFGITQWRPYFIEGLQKEPGAYTITLQLVDRSGKPVLGPWSSASQAISMQPKENAASGPASVAR
ncbi:MAG: hypothetical protein JW940_35075 [Polyangiaceae bacterium]|nr:hypothetical protein [Polyangiaceae bacterium]